MDPRYDVELVAVTKRYGSTVAVDDISLRVPKGGYCCLLGPSGCGKTSTLRMIAGHEGDQRGRPPDRRRATSPTCRRSARGTAMMFQNYALFPHLNCLDNVAFGLEDARRRESRAPPARARVPRPRADGRLRRAAAGAALGRPAAAHRARTRPHHAAARAAPGRAALGARPVPARAHARGAEAPAARARHHVHPRHARPGRGDGARRSHGGHGRRQASARPARRAEVFERPASAFVARFIGGHNVLPWKDSMIAVRTDQCSIENARRGRGPQGPRLQRGIPGPHHPRRADDGRRTRGGRRAARPRLQGASRIHGRRGDAVLARALRPPPRGLTRAGHLWLRRPSAGTIGQATLREGRHGRHRASRPDPCRGIGPDRGAQALARRVHEGSDRAHGCARAAAQCLHHPHERGGDGGGRGRRSRDRARQPARAAPRHPLRRKGYLRHRRRAHLRTLANLHRPYSGKGLDRGGQAARSRRRAVGQARHARVCPRRAVVRPALAAGAQPLEYGALHRRLVVGLGSSDCGGPRSGESGVRYGRIDPRPRRPVRHRGAQAHLWPREPRGRAAQLVLLRSLRADGANERGLCAHPQRGRRS